VLGYAYRSFILTVGDKSNPLQAFQDLKDGKKLLAGLEKEKDVIRFFEHFERHFMIKAIESAYQGSKDWGHLMDLHTVLRKRARRMMSDIEKIQDQFKEFGDAESIGDTLELLGQISIMAGKLGKAENAANDSQIWRSFIGRMSNALQSDRLLGWIYLAYGGQANRLTAIGYFARGFERALDLPNEPSLSKKLGADLIRAIWADNLRSLIRLEGRARDVNSVKAKCRAIQTSTMGEGKNISTITAFLSIHREDAADITEYVLFLYGKDGETLKSEIARLSNLERYPIYRPLQA
jgi:hypothetical protein